MSGYNKHNYYMGTVAIWAPCVRPDREPDYVSASGSQYWYAEDGVVRESNHWGSGVASCDWYMSGGEDMSCSAWHAVMCGYCAWSAFVPASEDEVTVYGIAEVEAEARDGMGIPYHSYAVTPDMMADGYVHVHGASVRYDRYSFMSIHLAPAPVAPKLPPMAKVGYTYAAYHRGARRGEPQRFVRVDKRAVDFAGSRRVRNVFQHPVTGEEYILADGYFYKI